MIVTFSPVHPLTPSPPHPVTPSPRQGKRYNDMMPGGRLSTWWRGFLGIPAGVLIGVVRLYQCLFSPLLRRHCRFQPTCSHYFIEAVRKYGVIRGGWRGIVRICRCHPWHPGGYDPP